VSGQLFFAQAALRHGDRQPVDRLSGRDWTATGIEAILHGPVRFHQDAANDTDPPNPMFFTIPGFWDSEYTSYFTSPGDYPNGPHVGGVVSFALREETPTRIRADFFDTIDTGNGRFDLVQLSIVPVDPNDPEFWDFGNWYLELHLLYAAANTGGELFELHTLIPEPGSLALLALGAAALVRRGR